MPCRVCLRFGRPALRLSALLLLPSALAAPYAGAKQIEVKPPIQTPALTPNQKELQRLWNAGMTAYSKGERTDFDEALKLWQVDDVATRDLMLAFYKKLNAGQRKDDALRNAMLAVKAEAGKSAPFYWAAFQVIGDIGAL